MKQTKSDILQGTLGLLILRTLAHGEMHGWGVSQRLQQISQDVLQVTQGSLHPALYRLEQQGWIESSWGDSDNTGARSSTGSPSPGTARSPRKPRAGSGHDCRRPGPRAGVSPAADLELETVARGAGPAEARGARCAPPRVTPRSCCSRSACPTPACRSGSSPTIARRSRRWTRVRTAIEATSSGTYEERARSKITSVLCPIR